jgi:hypothetical protein
MLIIIIRGCNNRTEGCPFKLTETKHWCAFVRIKLVVWTSDKLQSYYRVQRREVGVQRICEEIYYFRFMIIKWRYTTRIKGNTLN